MRQPLAAQSKRIAQRDFEEAISASSSDRAQEHIIAERTC
jgi:hypothetical protein